MTRRVDIGSEITRLAHERFGDARSSQGGASEYDFVAGPAAAAQFAFRDFDQLSFDLVPSVRTYTVVDPIFGAVTFVGLLRTDGVVEVVSFDDDPDYWATVEADPD